MSKAAGINQGKERTSPPPPPKKEGNTCVKCISISEKLTKYNRNNTNTSCMFLERKTMHIIIENAIF